MPPRPKTTPRECELEKAVDEQKKLLAEQQEKIGMSISYCSNEKVYNSGKLLDRLEADAKLCKNRKNLIPKPKGQAGRKNGYCLFTEMGVSEPLYRNIRVSPFL